MVTECIYGRKKGGWGKGGRHTRWFYSGDPVSTACVKKRREREEKTWTGPSKTRGKKGRTLSSPERASLFSLSFLWFFPLFFFSPSLFHLYPKSFSFSLLPVSLFLLPLIILSPSVSLRHVFQGLPSLDTVSTNSSPPVPSREPPGEGGELAGGGEGLQGRPAGYGVIRVSWRGGHKPSYLITTAARSGDAWKEKIHKPASGTTIDEETNVSGLESIWIVRNNNSNFSTLNINTKDRYNLREYIF